MDIIIPIAIVAVIVVFFVWISKSGAKMLKMRQERMNRPENEKGKAKILGFSQVGLSGTGSSGRYQAYKFTLEVSSSFKSPYKTESVWEVYPMGAPAVQTGMEVNVKIDAEDPNIIYPLVPNVEFSWLGDQINKHKEK